MAATDVVNTPLALILGIIDIVLVVHAARSGRFNPWAYVILMIPVFGALALGGLPVISRNSSTTSTKP